MLNFPKANFEKAEHNNKFSSIITFLVEMIEVLKMHLLMKLIHLGCCVLINPNNQGHPTTIFGKCLFGRRFEI